MKFSISRSAQLTLFSTHNSFGFNWEMESVKDPMTRVIHDSQKFYEKLQIA